MYQLIDQILIRMLTNTCYPDSSRVPHLHLLVFCILYSVVFRDVRDVGFCWSSSMSDQIMGKASFFQELFDKSPYVFALDEFVSVLEDL